jgi:hypothetical protein
MQAQLGAQIGIPATKLSVIEAGGRQASPQLLRRILQAIEEEHRAESQ